MTRRGTRARAVSRRDVLKTGALATAGASVFVVDDEFDRVVYVVTAGEMGQAIGPDGARVKRLEETIGRGVELVEDASTAEAFVANALAPAAVYNVTISENGDVVAYVEVDHADKGVAIGTDGRNIRAAKLLAERHYGVDDIQLT